MTQLIDFSKKVTQADKLLAGGKTKRNKEDTIQDNNPDEIIDPDKFLKPSVPEAITKEHLRRIYPLKVNDKILEQSAEIVNSAMSDMDFIMAKQFRDNCLSFIDTITEGRRNSNFEDYVAAVKFATFKFAGNTDIRAYSLTFPDRINRMAKEGLPSSYLYSYAQSWASSKIVTDVMAKMIVPTHIMYQDIFHQAVKTQAEIMLDQSVSPKVRSDAANSLMTHLKQPEIKKAELQIKTNDGAIDSLAQALNNLSAAQKDMMVNGNYSTRDLREATIIEVEANE